MSRYCRFTLLAVVSSGSLAASGPFAAPGEAQETYPEALWSSLEWRSVGPPRGGRSIAVAGSEARPFEYYMGTTGGGLWKTTDGGQNWRPVTDGQINSASIGAVEVCRSDPDIVYMGTGETQLRGNIQQGDGAYRSTDGGVTWEHVGLKETQNIARIRIHRENCDVAWAAAFGKHSADNPERGVFKTTDGGATWRKVLFRSDKAGAADISVDVTNPDVIYASIWEAWRRSWGMSSGGEDSGLFKSSDGGETWNEITANVGLSEGPVGKIGVAVSPANPDRVWALIEHEPDGGVWRSDDAGATWTRVNDERKLRQRAFYYTRVYADPNDEDVMYALNTGLYRSRDGGETFPRGIRVPHGDNHDLWIAPDDSDRMVNANDGGANVTFNGGRSWTDQDYSTAQFYRVVTTNHQPYHICGGQQDNSTACIPVRGWNRMAARGPGNRTWYYAVGGCESGYIAPHPTDLNIFYAGCYGGSLSRFDMATGARRAIHVWPENPMGQSSEDLVERVQWTFPIVFSHHDPDVLYTGTQKVWKTTTEGQGWEPISPDLTRADPATMGPSGGPITKDQTGVETYATVFAIAPSHHDPQVIWAGSDDGLVHVTRDGGLDWTPVTPPDAPDFVRINTIEASPNTPGKAYVSGIRYLVDDDRSPYVWRTEDYGRSWTKIVGGLPEDDFIRATREDPKRPGLLYAASERTVYVSFDDGARWQPLSLNLPVVQVSDLVVEENDLVIATHGRSFWVLEGIGPLRQMSAEVAAAPAWLFDPADPVRRVDPGVRFQYHLAEDAGSVTLEIVDSGGEVVRTFEATADAEEAGGNDSRAALAFGGGGGGLPEVARGAHAFRWDLRYPAWTDFEGRIMWAARPMGPMAVPGTYTVRMTVDDGAPLSRDFQVRMNPDLEGVTEADLRERFELAIRIRDRVSEANEAVIRVRDIKARVGERLEETDDEDIKAQAATVGDNLSAVEAEIYQVRNRSNQDPLNYPIRINNKLAALLGLVEGSESRPTHQSYVVFRRLAGLLDEQIEQLETVILRDVGRLNELLVREGLEPIPEGRPAS
ncbi:MAG: glycosyl hydrolase [Gemmatimonadota bacterium]|nr:glycosyl hydrolase [Gemmatimonadota bacterium]MDE2870795.1 glycosyl hydrolase [Gemmatimonadota bacterium]